MDFKGKVVIVTGASSGIGAGAAVEFALLGAQVVVVGRNAVSLQKTADACKEASQGKATEALQVIADVSKEEDVQSILDKTLAKWQRLDVLVNAAGIIDTGTIETTTLNQYDTIMGTNMRSVYHLTMLATPELIKTKGNIVNVSSVNGIRSFPGVLAYNVSKAALDQFTRCVALELASKGVRANCVNPGVIVTNIHKRGGMNDDVYAKFLEHSKTTHALGRVGQVEEVSGAITFLASDKASFITGASVPVDGGRHAMCPR